MKTVSIIGVGRVGGALALALSEKDYRIRNLIVQNKQKVSSIVEQISPHPETHLFDEIETISDDIIIIATQDSEIKNVAAKLNQIKINPETHIFHTSGSLSSDIIKNLKNKNCFVGSIHPLVSISDTQTGVKRFKNAYFCVEGDEVAIKTAEKIIKKLGGRSFSIETEYKTLYHASAVTACGHFVALIKTAANMLEICGLENKMAKSILMPLVKSTYENLEQQNFAKALTGTFARGDLETLENHIQTLEKYADQEQKDIYLQLGKQSLKLAEESGLDKKIIKKMTKKISLAKKNSKC